MVNPAPTPPAWRALYRRLLKTGHELTSDRRFKFYTFQHHLRKAFSPSIVTQSSTHNPSDQYNRGQRTLRFLKAAKKPESIERKVFDNLLFMRRQIDRFEARRPYLTRMRKSADNDALREVFHEYNTLVDHLNQSQRLALP
ncbi:hypothetical protein IWQ62_001603 [Dispira parvispora]|uniref:Uncharacterized protein n=1 Tax=Dispira parvispora TaxID=1520584 RepID=A0A9W8E8V8_9FUNG|nr:hypothetical protein IWQ62_001603 [Dispira parvispora]